VKRPSILLADERRQLDSTTSQEIMQVSPTSRPGTDRRDGEHEADIAAHAARVLTLA